MLRSILSIAVTLHWNPFGLYWGTLVMFVFPFFPSLFSLSLSPSRSPLVSWIDFPFVLDSRDAQCWFQLCGGCFIARSMFVYGGIPQFHSATRGSPRAGHIPASSALAAAQRWTRQTSDLCVSTCAHRPVQTQTQWHTYVYSIARTHTRTHHKPPSPHSILTPVSHCSKSS